MYASEASAASDLTNPDSPVSKMGIAGVKDPILKKAFRDAPPVAMAAGGRFLEGPGDGPVVTEAAAHRCRHPRHRGP